MVSAFIPCSPSSIWSHPPPLRRVHVPSSTLLFQVHRAPQRPKPSPASRRPHTSVRTGAFSSAQWKICVWEWFVSFRAQERTNDQCHLPPLFPPALPSFIVFSLRRSLLFCFFPSALYSDSYPTSLSRVADRLSLPLTKPITVSRCHPGRRMTWTTQGYCGWRRAMLSGGYGSCPRSTEHARVSFD